MRLEVGIIAHLGEVLGVLPERQAQFDWLTNKPSIAHFGGYYRRILDLFEQMGGAKSGLFARGAAT